MAKSLQRKKPGYTKSGVAKIVSMNTKELVSALDRASKKKEKAKIQRRLQRLGYVAPATVVEEAVAE
jgi:SOS response regulatory protein OraA/RecX